MAVPTPPAWFQHLPWDSQHFGRQVSAIMLQLTDQVRLSEVREVMLSQASDVTYLTVDEQHPLAQELQVAGFRVWDRKRVYVQDLPAPVPPPAAVPGYDLQPYTGPMTPALAALGVICGEYSRFKLDPRFAPESFQRLYELWVENSLSGRLAFGTYVAIRQQDQQPMALLTLGEKHGRADIGLVGVHAEARGQKLATRLVQLAQTEAQQRGYTQLQVVTQGLNEAACITYEKAGFRVESEKLVFHLWRAEILATRD